MDPPENGYVMVIHKQEIVQIQIHLIERSVWVIRNKIGVNDGFMSM